MRLAKIHHPDKNGGDGEKVLNHLFSSKKLEKPTKLLKMSIKEKCTINMARKDNKWEEAKIY